MNNEDRDDLAKALELNKRQAEFYNNISAKEDDELFKGYERNESTNLITRLWAKLRYAHQDAFENIGVDTVKNELPTFDLMKKKLLNSLKKDEKILKFIKNIYPDMSKKKFFYKVNIIKKDYLKMIQKRYISTLLPLTKKELLKGIKEIDLKYRDNIKFNDKLICIIL